MNMNITTAKAVPISDEITRRGIRLVGRGAERVGPCPICGGRDRFAININKQVFNCRACGVGGDVVDLVQHLDGVGFKTAVETLAGTTERKPVTKPMPPPVLVSDTENTTRALKLWDDASPINGTLAEEYLRRRGLFEPPEDDEALRYYGACPFGDSRYGAMLALFRDIITNEPKAIHRIALGAGGMLIGKKMLGPVAGCAVKIDADENVEQGLTIGEGIETVLAGRQLGFRPAWALGSSGAVRSFPVLAGIEALTILVDHDAADRNGRRAGQDDSLVCARRWHEAGKEVRRIIPSRSDTDMADIITKETKK
jgi:hypothetical protein